MFISILAGLLGWINLGFLIVGFIFFVSERIYVYWLETGSDSWKYFRRLTRDLERTHKIAGSVLIVSGFMHGFLELGYRFYFHTGFLVWFSSVLLLLTYLLGRWIPFLRRRNRWLLLHKYILPALIVFLIVHLINPWFI